MDNLLLLHSDLKNETQITSQETEQEAHNVYHEHHTKSRLCLLLFRIAAYGYVCLGVHHNYNTAPSRHMAAQHDELSKRLVVCV